LDFRFSHCSRRLAGFKQGAGRLPSGVEGTDPYSSRGSSGGGIPEGVCGAPGQAACARQGLVCRGWAVVALQLVCRSGGAVPCLTGTLSPELARLESLEGLAVRGNALYGTLPPEWGHLASLTVLDVSSNNLGGRLPEELSGLASLRIASFAGNRFLGERAWVRGPP
jgi:hypothetical protein